MPAWLADPALLSHQGEFYLYATSDGLPDWASPVINVWISPDLNSWRDGGEVLRLGRDVKWAGAKAWAPAIARRGGRVYLYYTAQGDGVGVAWAPTPVGPFTDLGHPLVAPAGGSTIDPAVFEDRDGAWYLLWGNTTAHLAPLAEDMMSIDTAQTVSWTPTAFREAIWLHRRAGTYYLSWSENDTRAPEYRVRYATGPSVFGPWTDQGVLLEQDRAAGILGTGHHTIIRLPGEDTWIIAYHCFTPGGDGYHRAIRFDFLIHGSDGSLSPVRPRDGAVVASRPT
ncbi:MAG: family 43 glycosylhydrolase [Bifidobacteriaceae bacterium]|nr:family 43 glycosylhydrolase [Bifidobacteriaceae bacterium]